MANGFLFIDKHTSHFRTKLDGWTQSVEDYYRANMFGTSSKREFIKDLGKNMEGLKDQVKSDYENTALRKQSQLRTSKSLGYEGSTGVGCELSDVFKYSMQQIWEQTRAVADGDMMDEIPTWPNWTQPQWMSS